jgi:hypothetical protein
MPFKDDAEILEPVVPLFAAPAERSRTLLDYLSFVLTAIPLAKQAFEADVSPAVLSVKEREFLLKATDIARADLERLWPIHVKVLNELATVVQPGLRRTFYEHGAKRPGTKATSKLGTSQQLHRCPQPHDDAYAQLLQPSIQVQSRAARAPDAWTRPTWPSSTATCLIWTA